MPFFTHQRSKHMKGLKGVKVLKNRYFHSTEWEVSWWCSHLGDDLAVNMSQQFPFLASTLDKSPLPWSLFCSISNPQLPPFMSHRINNHGINFLKGWGLWASQNHVFCLIFCSYGNSATWVMWLLSAQMFHLQSEDNARLPRRPKVRSSEKTRNWVWMSCTDHKTLNNCKACYPSWITSKWGQGIQSSPTWPTARMEDSRPGLILKRTRLQKEEN